MKLYWAPRELLVEHQEKFRDHPDESRIYLASEVDARIAELEKALKDLVTTHDGFRSGIGPCICNAHENARKVLGL